MSDKTKKPGKAKPDEAKPPGRPSAYSQELADQICERLSNGESLRSICSLDAMPSQSMVFRWLTAHPEFREQYALAREAQADMLVDQILEIADDGRNDTYMDDNGNVRTDTDVIARSKLRVEARKWMAGKLRPKVYGDKQTTELTGPNGGPVEFSVITRRIVKAT